MTKIAKTFTFVAIFSLLIIPQFNSALAAPDGYLFYGSGCPHCEKVINYFQSKNLFQRLNIDKREIYFNQKNLQEFLKICEEEKIPENQRGVPMLFYRGRCIIGDGPIISFADQAADSVVSGKSVEAVDVDNNRDSGNSKETTNSKLVEVSLLAVIGGAAADSINPCAFAVLILLMTTILASGNKRRALWAGLSFAASIFISYFLMGMGIYYALATARSSIILSKIIASLAILIGLANLKDVFWYGKGFIMEVPFSWRPKLRALVKSATSPVSAFLIGFLVSLFLLPCTSGPYIAILGMLSQKTTQARAIFYLLIYNLIFVLPMILITLGVCFGLDTEKAEQFRQKNVRLIHLIVAIIMLLIGFWLWFS
ncbi:MAG TPA: cytochrome c biogenesis protein [Candidatus Parcubacteria bacterium]|nr:cytochrome c biogenesis protein [Candidatus Parcubacteria bacterium]